MRSITHGELRRFIEDRRQNSTDAVETVNGRVRGIKALFNGLVQMGVLETSPATGLKQSKVQRRSPKGHPDELIKLLRKTSLEMNTRIALVVHLVTSTGARANEIATLRWSSIEYHGKRGRAEVIGKGNKSRKLFLGEIECELLRKWRVIRDGLLLYVLDLYPDKQDNDHVFWGMNGSLGYAGIRKDFNKCAQKAQAVLTAPMLHGCRHGFAKRWLKKGGDLKSLQDVLGHQNIQSTAIYLNYSEDELDEKHIKYAID